jgi:hypothetical protein
MCPLLTVYAYEITFGMEQVWWRYAQLVQRHETGVKIFLGNNIYITLPKKQHSMAPEPEGSSPPWICFLNQLNPLHTPPANVLKIHSDLTLSSTPPSSEWSLSFGLSHQKPCTPSSPMRATYPTHLSLLGLISAYTGIKNVAHSVSKCVICKFVLSNAVCACFKDKYIVDRLDHQSIY